MKFFELVRKFVARFVAAPNPVDNERPLCWIRYAR